MRISDWSSDVCSSDLRDRQELGERADQKRRQRRGRLLHRLCKAEHSPLPLVRHDLLQRGMLRRLGVGAEEQPDHAAHRKQHDRGLNRERSEEHTSELQSLMRISYAVFCLKKKKK